MNSASSDKKINISIYFSIVAMIVSLFLDVFIPMHGEASKGYTILLQGTVMGWMIPIIGWAVYANYFYGYVVLKLLKNDNKKPLIAISIMSALAMLTPIAANSPPINEDFMSWGWGAFVWGMAIFILTMIGFFRDLVSRSYFANFFIIIVGCLLFLIPPYLKGH